CPRCRSHSYRICAWSRARRAGAEDAGKDDAEQEEPSRWRSLDEFIGEQRAGYPEFQAALDRLQLARKGERSAREDELRRATALAGTRQPNIGPFENGKVTPRGGFS